MTATLLSIHKLKTYFPYIDNTLFKKVKGYVKAVDDVSFDINRGEILGLVGESGCGKSTLARTIMGLTKRTSGSITIEGRDWNTTSKDRIKKEQPEFQMIFQDPFSSLNPRMTVFTALSEPLLYHGWATKKDCVDMVSKWMLEVGLSPRNMNKYPHEFSGGQRQRIAIARALVLKPKLIVADEPVSALDVSIQSQILNLLLQLNRNHHLSMLFISHDLSVIRHIADRTAVMYLGKIIELGQSDQVFTDPKHPYTQALLSAIPLPDPAKEKNRKRILMTGDPPTALSMPSGCRFHTRCRYGEEKCAMIEPELETKHNGHQAACFFSDRIRIAS